METEFAKIADLEGTQLIRSGATLESAARIGYDAMLAGKLIAIKKALDFSLNWRISLFPRRTVPKMVSRMPAK